MRKLEDLGNERDTPQESPVKTWLEAPRWNKKFVPFGDRLDFLSPEKRHLESGTMKLLPARKKKEKRNAE